MSRQADEELIGSILLQQPFFFEQKDWIPLTDWAGSIVRGKTFDTDKEDGARLWQEVSARLATPLLLEESHVPEQRYGTPQSVLPRLGQGAFRVIVADGYHRQCAFSSSHILHVLDAAHIKPYAEGGTHSPNNGLLLRKDIHTLFDRGYVTVAPDYRIEVSRRIKEEFNNGVEYYAMHGKQIHLPESAVLHPSRELLTWHNERVFLG